MLRYFRSKYISPIDRLLPLSSNNRFSIVEKNMEQTQISVLYDLVLVSPHVVVSPQALVASPGSNVSFQCNASGVPDPVITWTKEGTNLPRRHLVANDVLTLRGLVGLDEGRYMCTATNSAGFSQKPVTLTVEGL